MALPPTALYDFCEGTPEDVYEKLKAKGLLINNVSKEYFIRALQQRSIEHNERIEKERKELEPRGCGVSGFDEKVRFIDENFLNSAGKRLNGDESAIDCEYCGKIDQNKNDVFCSECDYLLGEKSDFFFSENYCHQCGHEKEKNTFECSSCQSSLIRYQSTLLGMKTCIFCESDFPCYDSYCALCGKDPETTITPVRCKECGEFYTDDCCPSCKSKRGFFSKLINGDFGLAKTYWLYGVLVGFVVGFVRIFLPSFELLVIVSLAHFAFEIPVMIGVWKASSKYEGRKAWAILAKIATVLGIISLVAGLYGLFMAKAFFESLPS